MSSAQTKLAQLLAIIEKIAAGNYSDEIMSLTTKDTPEPIRTIAEAMGMMMVKVETREFQLEQLINELKQLNEQIRCNTVQTIASLAQALEARDSYTRGHAERVANYAADLALEMGLNEKSAEQIRIAGLLHDIGKIGFSDRIFHNFGPEDKDEIMQEIRTHPAIGATILEHLKFLDNVASIVLRHHEHVDGSGYPDGLEQEFIPLEARIVAVADAFDAMTTDRSYQKARSHAVALDLLYAKAGIQWDQDCVAAFERVLRRNNLLSLA